MAMTVVYLCEELPCSWKKAIFLLGPTSRKAGTTSWRLEALQILEELSYDGVVFVPESRPDEHVKTRLSVNYEDMTGWIELCLNCCDEICGWFPDSEDSIGLTSRFIWGTWEDSGKAVFGAPEGAPKTRHPRRKAQELGAPNATTLWETIRLALERIGDGAFRIDGEREVPLLVWRNPQFQQWYGNLKLAGNVLEHVRVVWTFRVGAKRDQVFFFALHAEVFIASEGRSKTNEIVLARPDIATIVLYKKAWRTKNTTIVLVREFRTPVSNRGGYVLESPGGSSFKQVLDPRELAAEECLQETGLYVSPKRFSYHGARQLVATLSAHCAHVCSAKITRRELRWLKSQKGKPHGVLEDSERTYVEIVRLGDILAGGNVDWAMMGMLLSVVR